MAVENKADFTFVIFNSQDLIVGYSGYINGKYKAEISVEPDTQYNTGDFRCAFVKYNEATEENELVTELVDVPAFKTKPIEEIPEG